MDLKKLTFDSDNKKLRGQRVNQIKQDLSDKSMTDRDKVLKYSEHLTWCLKTFERLFKLQESAATPGVWDKNPYAHGVLNGMIMAMAVVVEEQGNIPFQKSPKSYRMENSEWIKDSTYKHIEKLERKIQQIVMGNHKGPKDYQEASVPFQAWMQDALDILSTSPVQTNNMKKIRDEIFEYINQNTKPNR